MSIFNTTPIAVVLEEEIHAPFIGYCNCAAERLLRMGVTNEKDELREPIIGTLAATFASNFYDRLLETYKDDYDNFNSIYSAINELWMKKETTGMYFYITLCCGLIEYPMPKELMWIARREDALSKFMQKFTEALQAFIDESGKDYEELEKGKETIK